MLSRDKLAGDWSISGRSLIGPSQILHATNLFLVQVTMINSVSSLPSPLSLLFFHNNLFTNLPTLTWWLVPSGSPWQLYPRNKVRTIPQHHHGGKTAAPEARPDCWLEQPYVLCHSGQGRSFNVEIMAVYKKFHLLDDDNRWHIFHFITIPLSILFFTLDNRPGFELRSHSITVTTIQAHHIGTTTNTFTISRVGNSIYFESTVHPFIVQWNAQMNVNITVSTQVTDSITNLKHSQFCS